MSKMQSDSFAEYLRKIVSFLAGRIFRVSTLTPILAVFVLIGIATICGSVFQSPSLNPYAHFYAANSVNLDGRALSENPTVEYNIFHNTVPDGFAGSFSATNIEEDPKLDANYQPIWTASIMSPCIDAGYGNSDPDGTPPDIGAKRAVEHAFWEYTFEDQADADRWHWVSYPVLNTFTNNALKASVFFEELLHVHQKIVNG
ncbi:MAG: hypothetical protein PHY24_09510, partial [Candidatus Cloacimonetes bacterium]|nr:hypothetical protein [Candidatus Cloacimonadota bacterium]